MIKTFILAVFFILCSYADTQPQDLVKISAQPIRSGGETYLAVNFFNEHHWHTYWKNPGDSGLPIQFKFTYNSKEDPRFNEQALEWPAPKKYLEAGNILAYGYSDSYTFFFATEDLNQKRDLEVNYLVCKDICIPGSHKLSLEFTQGKVTPTSTHPNSALMLEQSELRQRMEDLPVEGSIPNELEIFLSRHSVENQLVLNYVATNFDLQRFDSKKNLLTPFPLTPFGFTHEKLFYDQQTSTLYGKLIIEWDGDIVEPEVPLPQDGVFPQIYPLQFLLNWPEANTKIISFPVNQFSTSPPANLESLLKGLPEVHDKDSLLSKRPQVTQSLLLMLLFAFLGGLILNLMPCVLPVISLKLFGMIIHQGLPRAQILKHNLTYSLGILSSFWALAAIIIALQFSGSQVGWGFQLQSPQFVAVMILFLLILSINMFGVFEFITPGGKKLGNAQLKQSLGGDFLSGVLATILSTPCSAPFLGTALGFAFTTGPLTIFLILSAVAIGLAFPFIITGFFPALVSFLPKPGLWMDNLKKVLGVTLLLTVIWLYDVLMGIVDFSLVNLPFNTLILLSFFSLYVWNRLTKNFWWRGLIIAITLLCAYTTWPLLITSSPKSGPVTQSQKWESWSEEKIEKIRTEGEVAFVDFTAKWCLTCKVNKKLVLDTEGFYQFAQENNLKLFIADWTKRDPKITQFLRSYELVGVPAYFLLNRKGELVSLGETISIDEIQQNL